jgi:hypothetical protein
MSRRLLSQHEHRVGQLAARHRGYDDVVNVDARARRLGRVEGAPHDAALNGVAHARHMALGERRFAGVRSE